MIKLIFIRKTIFPIGLAIVFLGVTLAHAVPLVSVEGKARQVDPYDPRAFTSFNETGRSFVDDSVTGFIPDGSFSRASASADLRGNTRGILKSRANGSTPTVGPGPHIAQADAKASFTDTWTFTRAPDSTGSWSVEVETWLTGNIRGFPTSNGFSEVSAFFATVNFSNITPGIDQPEQILFDFRSNGPFERQTYSPERGNGFQTRTFDIPETITEFQFDISGVLHTEFNLFNANGSGGNAFADVDFGNTGGFRLEFNDDVTFSSASGVTAFRGDDANPIPGPSTFLLFGSGWAGYILWRLDKNRN